jgi:hypothetical protein
LRGSGCHRRGPRLRRRSNWSCGLGGSNGGLRGFRFGFFDYWGRLWLATTLNRPANLYRDIFRDRTRVRFLFRDSVARKKIDDRFGLYFQLAGQLVNSDLICFAQDFASSECSEPGFADSESSSAA